MRKEDSQLPDTARTLNEIYPEWKEDHSKYTKTSTMAAYNLIVRKYIIPVWGEDKIVTREMAEKQVIDWIENGLSKKTIQDIIIVVKMLLAFASEKGWQPFYKFSVRYPNNAREKNRELKRYTPAQMAKLIGYCSHNYNNKNLGILITCLTGMRIGEICGLKFGDIDIASGKINVNRTLERQYDVDMKKTGLIFNTPKTKNSYRSIPICSQLNKILKPLDKICNPDFFVVSNTDKPTEPRVYRNYFNKITEELKLPKLNYHGLRHSFASMMIESKVDVKTVSTILGHADISTTLNLYCHPTEENKKKAIDKVFRL